MKAVQKHLAAQKDQRLCTRIVPCSSSPLKAHATYKLTGTMHSEAPDNFQTYAELMHSRTKLIHRIFSRSCAAHQPAAIDKCN